MLCFDFEGESRLRNGGGMIVVVEKRSGIKREMNEGKISPKIEREENEHTNA